MRRSQLEAGTKEPSRWGSENCSIQRGSEHGKSEDKVLSNLAVDVITWKLLKIRGSEKESMASK